MSRTRREHGCHDLPFTAGYALSEAGEVALEDYARVLAGAGAAEVIPDASDPPRVAGVHVCGAAEAPPAALVGEVEQFARGLAHDTGRTGLGWE